MSDEPLSWLTLLVVLPVVSGFVGWITNWMAVRMIFWPETFKGWGRFGWQGVIFHHNHKFAEATAELASSSLLSPADITSRIGPEEMEEIYDTAFEAQAHDVVREFADTAVPGMWDRLPGMAQDLLVSQVRSEGKVLVHELFESFQENSEELIDLHALTVDALTRDDGRTMARLALEFGATELAFIVRYGAVFGAAIGFIEALLWGIFQSGWLLPVVGGLVGAGTNWLALQMIFRPHEPTEYLGLVTYQGLFPKRQQEIAHDYSKVAATDILNAQNLIGMLTQGEGGERMARMVFDTLSARIDAGVARFEGPLHLPSRLGAPLLDRLKQTLYERMLAAMPQARPQIEAYLDEKLGLAETIRERLAELTKPEFEGILRGIFEEDEWILIAIGGVLGGLIGLGQAILIGVL